MGLWPRARCDMGQKKLDRLQLWRHPQKNQIQNFNFFSIEITRLSACLDGLNSSLVLAAGELWPNMCLVRSWPLRALKDLWEHSVHQPVP